LVPAGQMMADVLFRRAVYLLRDLSAESEFILARDKCAVDAPQWITAVVFWSFVKALIRWIPFVVMALALVAVHAADFNRVFCYESAK